MLLIEKKIEDNRTNLSMGYRNEYIQLAAYLCTRFNYCICIYTYIYIYIYIYAKLIYLTLSRINSVDGFLF